METITDLQSDSGLIDGNAKYEIHVYKRRWLILLIFILYAAISAFQCIEYVIITNIVMRYYNVSLVSVEWTSLVFMALYAPLIVPASYIIDKKGLRVAVLIGSIGSVLGTAIKLFSINRDSFYVVLIGQTLLAVSQLLIFPLPPKIAAVWFKPNEVSTACALGIFGIQLGCAVGFVLPPMIVKNHQNPELIGADLRRLCWGLTILMTLVTVFIIIYFPAQPTKAPSVPQATERSNQCKYSITGFVKAMQVLLRNQPFVIHMVACGIIVGVSSAIGTLLNQLILKNFQNAEEDAGRIGLLMVVAGMVGSITFGIILDKTQKYKETTFLVCLLSGLSAILVMFALELRSLVFVYFSMIIFGLFASAYMPVGFEFAIELTYPSPESTTTGLLIAPSQILGVIFTLTLGYLNELIGPFWALSSQVGLLFLGTAITAFIPNICRRQSAFEMQKIERRTDERIK